MLDVFKNEAFSVTSLTDAVSESKVRPGRLGEMGLFSATSVPTISIAIERIGDLLQIVPPSPRGAPGDLRDMPKRELQDFSIPHFQRDWSIYADEVQGIRAFGSETVLETVQGKVADRLAANLEDLNLTEEYARLGAIQGIITYKGGSQLNLFDKFGVLQPTEISFGLTNPSPIEGSFRKACVGLIRRVRAAIGRSNFDYVHAFVGDNFFDDLFMHSEFRDTFKGWSDSRILKESYVGKNRSSNPIVEFCGIVWENYGAIEAVGDGALMGIPTDKAKFIPVGVPGLFRTYYAPADYNETVNTMGKRRYAKQWPMSNDKGINGEVQMNALQLCTRPAALFSGRRT
jgi:hypothetical protein